MTEYDFIANDWDSVGLLFGEHLTTETGYHEQMLRWSLRYARCWGVAVLADSDLIVSGSERDYEVSLRGCKAITRRGFIIEAAQGSEALSLQGSNTDQPEQLVPIYVGISTRKEAFSAGASQSGLLDERFLLRWRMKLAHDPDSADYEWLQIGRMRREGARFVRDENYIPHCLHINSHPSMRQITGDIAQTAQGAIKAVEEATQRTGSATAWKPMAAAFVGSLAPAAVVLNGDMHPRAYLERLAIVIEAQQTLLKLIDGGDGSWVAANDRVREARNYLFGERRDEPGANGPPSVQSPIASFSPEPDSGRPAKYWWEAFQRVLLALRAIQAMFQGTMPSAPQTPEATGRTVVKRPTDFQDVRRT